MGRLVVFDTYWRGNGNRGPFPTAVYCLAKQEGFGSPIVGGAYVMRWWEVRLDVPKEASEAVAALFHEYPDIHGVAMEGGIVNAPLHPDYGEWLADDLRNDCDTTIAVYIPESVSADAIHVRVEEVLGKVRSAKLLTGKGDVNLKLSLVDESLWENAWKEHLHPIEIGSSFVIVPKWRLDETEFNGKRNKIVLEPGMAFGTGTHETTQMCIEAIELFSPSGKQVLDVGCGTAVLSIAAALRGAAQVLAVDIDPVAVAIAKDNVVVNGFSDIIQARIGNLLEGFVKNDCFNMILANILRDVVVALTPEAVTRLSPGGIFITSGYIREQTGVVHRALHHSGLEITKVLQKNDWMCTVAVKPS
jgi:ribosomal protein L11 methyltransferase